MDFQLPIQINALPRPLNYQDAMLLVGSCFTEHIGHKLEELKFKVLQNPNGILFDPHSVATNLLQWIGNKPFSEDDLFYYNELWQSWQHHSIFSKINKQDCLQQVNAAQAAAHEFLKKASCLMITLGSSFSYRLNSQYPFSSDKNMGGRAGDAVANCHRAPAQWFNKHLMDIEETEALLSHSIRHLLQFNPNLTIIFTVSPVRHIRDGVTENNRSKARLIEAVHRLVHTYNQSYYFPAYELVIDVLRDYRFYDIDMVHPNYPATSFVMEHFMAACMDLPTRQLMEELKKIVMARKHKPFQPATQAHRQFLRAHLEKAAALQQRYPFLNLEEELEYFNNS